ncbi:hypothetical protein ANCCAN_03027 [Ancylostoma caninum]|uniref:Uncharacterized protein n=1 Tax=Ancylostoma caninum TaxID=29170 RepID=A0A368H4Z9_ANCCA|nr:hypothetical protein ANCCAN_03027 [Ancylostoma caninum]
MDAAEGRISREAHASSEKSRMRSMANGQRYGIPFLLSRNQAVFSAENLIVGCSTRFSSLIV